MSTPDVFAKSMPKPLPLLRLMLQCPSPEGLPSRRRPKSLEKSPMCEAKSISNSLGF
jgi:hypothetical protein